MPKDPFNFHVRDLLQNDELEPYDRDVVNMWPPRDRRVPDPNLQAGSDDIEINLDEYDYWLPVEAEEEKTAPLAVSENK